MEVNAETLEPYMHLHYLNALYYLFMYSDSYD